MRSSTTPRPMTARPLQISVRHIGRPMNVYAYYGNGLPEYQWVSGNIQTARSDGTILKGWRQVLFRGTDVDAAPIR